MQENIRYNYFFQTTKTIKLEGNYSDMTYLIRRMKINKTEAAK